MFIVRLMTSLLHVLCVCYYVCCKVSIMYKPYVYTINSSCPIEYGMQEFATVTVLLASEI